MLNKSIAAAALVASLLAVGGPAQAVPLVGSVNGSFSSLASCDNSGSDRDCRIVATAANGSNSQVQWGSQHRTTDFVNPSTLTSVDLAFNTETDAIGLQIGRLDWYNSATLRLNSSLDSFDVRWSLNVNFTSPSGPDPYGAETFSFNIRNPINPTGDSLYGLGLTDLRNLQNSITLNGVTITNLRYAVADGAGAGTSYFSDNYWFNSEENWSTLYILADVYGPAVTPVPEPETYAMLLAGLGVLSAVARRRQKKEAAARQ